MNRLPYPSDLTDAEWRLLEPLLPPPQPGGRPIKYPRREIVNAILYTLRIYLTHRRRLASAAPRLPAVSHRLSLLPTWRKAGVWPQVNDALRQRLRQSEGRHPEPGAAIIDSQSVKTAAKGGRAVTMPAKSSGPQASYRGGYGGAAAGGSSASGGCAGSGRRAAGIVGTGGQNVAAAADLG